MPLPYEYEEYERYRGDGCKWIQICTQAFFPATFSDFLSHRILSSQKAAWATAKVISIMEVGPNQCLKYILGGAGGEGHPDCCPQAFTV